jgi:hypothetical protein
MCFVVVLNSHIVRCCCFTLPLQYKILDIMCSIRAQSQSLPIFHHLEESLPVERRQRDPVSRLLDRTKPNQPNLERTDIFLPLGPEAETKSHYRWKVKLVWMESTSLSNSLIGHSLKRRSCSLVRPVD